LIEVLHNPAYAGAFVYGRKGPHPQRRPGQSRSIRRPLEEWAVVHQGVYPAYLSWEQFVSNQARLADNASTFARRARGATRHGAALLAGLVVCGRCGYQMHVTYKPQQRYSCSALAASYGAATCLHVDGASLEAVVVDAFFAALPRTTTAAAELARRHDDKVPDDRALTTAEDDRPVHYALEFRSRTFVTPEATDVLRRHEVATVLADTAGRWPKVDEDTGPVRYVRLHGDQELYASGYTDRALDEWAERCRGWAEAGQDVFVYFDNDMKGYAPHDARRLIERLGDAT
jgi:hypothetical protein